MPTWVTRAVLLSFWVFSAWYLYIGGLLTKTLSFSEALIAIAIANVIFAFIFTLYAGAGKPKDILFREAFGIGAAKHFFSFLPTLTQIGWYAVVVEIGGTATAMALGFSQGTVSFYSTVLVYGLLTIWIATGGLNRIGKLSYFSTPAMLAFLTWGTWSVFHRIGSAALFSYEPSYNSSIEVGVQLLLASFISAAVTIPDFLHDLKVKKNIFLASFWGLVPTAILVGGMGAAFAIVGKSYDVLATLQLMSGPLFVYGLLSIDNLCGAQAVFPVGTGFASIFSKPNPKSQERGRIFWTVAGGLIAVAIAEIGIVKELGTWLTILGTIFSPIIGVVLANQYLVKKDLSRTRIYFPALIAWIIGCGISFIPVGVPILQAMLASLLAFVCIDRIFGK